MGKPFRYISDILDVSPSFIILADIFDVQYHRKKLAILAEVLKMGVLPQGWGKTPATGRYALISLI